MREIFLLIVFLTIQKSFCNLFRYFTAAKSFNKELVNLRSVFLRIPSTFLVGVSF